MIGLAVKNDATPDQPGGQAVCALFPVHAHSHLTVIYISPTAAGFNRQLVIVGQVLGRRNAAATLGIIAFQIGQIGVQPWFVSVPRRPKCFGGNCRHKAFWPPTPEYVS